MPLITKASLLSVFDLRNVSKRVYIIYSIACIAGLVLSVVYYSLNLTKSWISTALFCFSLGAVILLKRAGILNKIEYYFLVIVSAHLIISVIVEGAQSGQCFYYFPLLIGIPVIIDFEKSHYKTLLFNFIITIISFLICLFLGLYTSAIEPVPHAAGAKIYLCNAISSIFMTGWFAATFIRSQKLNFEDLIEQKNNTISSRTRFLSTMGHELRTPLNGVLGAVNLLKEENYLSEDNEYYRILKYCSKHMLNLVNDILDFNKIEAGKLEVHLVEINLQHLITNAILPFQNSFEEKNLQLILDVAPELNELIWGDDVRIIQILNNLLSNALKFTEKGFVKLSVLCKDKNDTELTAKFTVEDTGLGIAKEDQSKIFESFWQVYDASTRKYTGTGLGLSICLRLLELMDSSLNLTSEKGKGSTFSFTINFNLAAKQHLPLLNNQPEIEDLSGFNILIAEDNKINMMIAKKILTGYKAAITCAYNGKEALDILEQGADYALILMDLEMPVMNGFTAITKVKEMYPTIPVIAFTASLMDQEMLAELMSLGFTDFISKPFEPHQMFMLLKKHAALATVIS
ncbi:MAG: ATP-binding response regulator [Janthinobacterium lividum]